MSIGRTLFSRAAVTDLGLNGNERRMFFISFCFFDSLADGSHVRAVFDGDGLEAESGHAGLDIFREGQVRTAFNGNAVAVIKNDQLGQTKGSGQGKGFGRNTFHQAAVAAKGKGVVVDDGIVRFIENSRQMSFGHSHADSHAKACAERTRRSFNAGRMGIFRMARCQGAVLTELLNIIQGKAVAIQVKQRIQQHRAVAGREDKAVPVRPFRVFCIVVHVICPKFIGNRGSPQGQSGMAGICLLDCIRRQYTNGIYTSRINGAH